MNNKMHLASQGPMQANAIRVAQADKRAMRVNKLMSRQESFAFRLAALNAMGGERRLS